jgi:hypothetical protein
VSCDRRRLIVVWRRAGCWSLFWARWVKSRSSWSNLLLLCKNSVYNIFPVCYVTASGAYLCRPSFSDTLNLYPYRKPTNASNDHFIVMSRQMFLHVSAYQRHHQGAHMILTSYLYVGVHYKKNNGVSNKIASVSIVTLWKWVVMANCCWKLHLGPCSTTVHCCGPPCTGCVNFHVSRNDIDMEG